METVSRIFKALLDQIPTLMGYLAGKRGAEKKQAEEVANVKDKQTQIAASPRKSRKSLLKWMRNDKGN